MSKRCTVEISGQGASLIHPAFVFALNLSPKLKASEWANRLTGETLNLRKANEFGCSLDASKHRIDITRWRQTAGSPAGCSPNRDEGYKREYYSHFFNDREWDTRPIPQSNDRRHETIKRHDLYQWARTHFVLPADAKGKTCSLILGGYGLFDYAFMRIFLNGTEITTRQVQGRWREPIAVTFTPGSKQYKLLRFAGDNVIALQLKGYFSRPPQLDEVDPGRWFAWKYPPTTPVLFDQYITVGKPLRQMRFRAVSHVIMRTGKRAEFVVRLEAKEGLHVETSYSWDVDAPVLTKQVSLLNSASHNLDLLDIELGDYITSVCTPDNGGLGVPVYIADQFFASIADPSGFNQLDRGRLRFRYFLGKALKPGQSLVLPKVVYGVAQRGQHEDAFRSYVLSSSRRRLRNHNKPYSTFNPMNPDDNFFKNEKYELSVVDSLERMKKTGAMPFDLFGLGYFMIDSGGDFVEFDKRRWPNGSDEIMRRLKKLPIGVTLGLSASAPIRWSIGDNPAVADCISNCGFCMAAEPYKTLVQSGMNAYVDKFNMECFIIDEFAALCNNPHHGHRVGKYSITANHNAMIELLRKLDRKNPALLVMLYWGFRSPWWVLWADTLFEPSGIDIEARNPSDRPMLYFRDAITLGLDRAHAFAKNIPTLCKDSLGIWLTDNPWNAHTGKERWQAGFVMDMCRGSLLAQLWGHPNCLTAQEQKEADTFIRLLKARPDCFANPQLVIGDPWKDDVYAYCCSNGNRAFIALNNSGWSEATVNLELNDKWGLPNGRRWQLVRRWPKPAQLLGQDGRKSHGDKEPFALRPFDIVLIEVMDSRSRPTLDRQFVVEPLLQAVKEPTSQIPLKVTHRVSRTNHDSKDFSGTSMIAADGDYRKNSGGDANLPIQQTLRVNGKMPPVSSSATLAFVVEFRHGRFPARVAAAHRFNSVSHLGLKAEIDCAAVAMQPVVRNAMVPWQVYYATVTKSAASRDAKFWLTSTIGARQVQLKCSAYLLPGIIRR